MPYQRSVQTKVEKVHAKHLGMHFRINTYNITQKECTNVFWKLSNKGKSQFCPTSGRKRFAGELLYSAQPYELRLAGIVIGKVNRLGYFIYRNILEYLKRGRDTEKSIFSDHRCGGKKDWAFEITTLNIYETDRIAYKEILKDVRISQITNYVKGL